MQDLSFKQRLLCVQSELKAPKNLFNSFGKYKYRNAEGILEAAKPLLKKHNLLLVITDDVIQVGERYYVKAIATVSDVFGSESESASALARESFDKKGQDDSQITGTASSYARKYALNGLFLLDDTKDADTDEYRNQREAEIEKQQAEAEQKKIENSVVSEVKVKALLARCEKEGVDPNKILKLYKVKSLADLTELKYRNICDHFEDIKKA